MSIWTHVVGCIRVDGIPAIGMPKGGIECIRQILGPVEDYENLGDVPDCTLPSGSEGSLDYRIIKYDDGARWVAVAIWGDLRDVDDTQPIHEWWNRVLAAIGAQTAIRDAVILVQVEGRCQEILTHAEPVTEEPSHATD